MLGYRHPRRGARPFYVRQCLNGESTSSIDSSLALPVLSLPPVMLKRPATTGKTARKKKKGNATYSSTSLDDNNVVTEELRVWDISTSKKTGRVNASRRTHKLSHQASGRPESPSVGEGSGAGHGGMATEVDEAGTFADSEATSETASKKRPKRKRTRVVKENDSVSGLRSPAR